MKLKSLLDKEKRYRDDIEDCNCELCIAEKSNVKGSNAQLKQDGNIEVELDVKKAKDIIIEYSKHPKLKLGMGQMQQLGEIGATGIVQRLNDHLAECLVRKKK